MTFILSGLVFTGTAGDENNPEIVDIENDLMGGRRGILLPRIFYPIFNYVDILSGWFFENQNQQDILFASIKMKTFDYKPFNSRFIIFWYYDYVDYVAGFSFHSNGDFKVGFAGYIDENGTEHLQAINYLIDEENGIITFQIPKDFIGNPIAGEELLYPWIWTGCNFQNTFLNQFWPWELAKDFTFEYDGSPYIIQY